MQAHLSMSDVQLVRRFGHLFDFEDDRNIQSLEEKDLVTTVVRSDFNASSTATDVDVTLVNMEELLDSNGLDNILSLEVVWFLISELCCFSLFFLWRGIGTTTTLQNFGKRCGN